MRREPEPQEIEAAEKAVYRMADGPYCYATNRQIAKMANLRSPELAGACLKALRDNGVLKLYDWRNGVSMRFHVILGHPQALEAMANHYVTISDPMPYLRVVGG